MDCHANALAAACAFACHKTSWLVIARETWSTRPGGSCLVPTSLRHGVMRQLQQHRRQHFQLMQHCLVAQTTLVFPGLGWLREVKRHCAVPTLPVSLAHLPESPPIPSSFLHRSAYAGNQAWSCTYRANLTDHDTGAVVYLSSQPCRSRHWRRHLLAARILV